MAHLGETGLKKLKEVTVGMELVQDQCLCMDCVLGRIKGNAHKYPIKCGMRPLELIHTDISGPFPVPRCRGEQYWVTFIDDYTQIAEAYPIEYKDEFFDKFRQFMNRYERPERHIRRVRLDFSGENQSQVFVDYCTDKGIMIEFRAASAEWDSRATQPYPNG